MYAIYESFDPARSSITANPLLLYRFTAITQNT